MRAPGEGNDLYLKYFIGIYFISVAEATLFEHSASYPCSTWGCLGLAAVCGQEACVLLAPGGHARALQCCRRLHTAHPHPGSC